MRLKRIRLYLRSKDTLALRLPDILVKSGVVDKCPIYKILSIFQ